MEIGIRIPHAGPLASAPFVVAFSTAAETAGFDGLWTTDHVVAPVHTDSLYTLTPQPARIADGAISATMGLNLEMNTTMAVVAALTQRVKLWTGVAILPIRNAVLNARQIASIDLYSGGRVVYGVGAGWLREEAEAMSMPWDKRGARTDEQIALMRTLWTAPDDVVEFKGTFHRLPPMDPNPRPIQQPIPILIGGHSDAALDRAARIGDGWIASGMGDRRLRAALDALAASCERYGSDFKRLQIVCGERFTLDPSNGSLPEQADRIVEGISNQATLGVTHAKVGIKATDRSAMLEMLDAYGQLVLPAVHLQRRKPWSSSTRPDPERFRRPHETSS